MGERDKHDTGAEPLDLRDPPRPLPASEPVIAVSDKPADVDGVTSPEHPAIDSSILGDGDLPAAEPKTSGESTWTKPDGVIVTETSDGPEAVDTTGTSDVTDPTHERRAADISRLVQHAAAPLPPERRGGFFPLFLGGVAAAALGAGATLLAAPQLTRGAGVDQAAITAEAVAAAKAEIAAQAAALDARAAEAAKAAVAALPAGTSPDLAPLADRIAALESRPLFAPVAEGDVPQNALAPLIDQLNAHEKRLQELAARPAGDPAANTEAARLAAEAEARLKEAAAAAEGAVTKAAADAQAKLTEAQAAADAMQADVAAAAQKAERLAALAALQTTLQTTGDRQAAVATLTAAGVEAPAALAEAPALEQLQADFAPAARDGLKASLKAVSPATGNVLTNFLRAQTGARSLEPQAGADPDAVLSRANAAVAAGDIKTALAEIATLPEAGRAAMANWTRGADAWLAASGAVAQIEGQLK